MTNSEFKTKLSKTNSIGGLMVLRSEVRATGYTSQVKNKLRKKLEASTFAEYTVSMRTLSSITRLTDAGEHSFNNRIKGRTQLAKDANGRKIEVYVFEKENRGSSAVIFVKFTK